MSDWRSRAKPVEKPQIPEASSKAGWRTRAAPVGKSVAKTSDYAQISSKDSALAGAAQGGLFGFADEAMGAIKAAGDVLSGHDESFSDRYEKRRDSYRKYFNESQKQNPKSHFAGELTSGVATSFIPGVGLTQGGKIASLAVPSAVAGLGYSEEKGLGGQLQDAAIGGATGVVTGKLFEKVENLVGSAKNKLKDFAQKEGANRLLKASGAMTGDFRRIDKRGPDARIEAAEWLSKNKAVPLFGDIEDVAKNTRRLKSEAGQEIGDILDSADSLRDETIGRLERLFDSAVKSGEISPELAAKQKSEVIRRVQEEFGYNPSNIAKQAEGYVASKQKSPTFRKGSQSFFQDHAAENRAVADEFGPMSLREGLQEKISQRDEIGPNMTVGKRNKKRVYDWTRDELDRAVGNYERLGSGLKKLDGVPGSNLLDSGDDALKDKASSMVQRYRDANKQMAVASEMEEMARRSVGRESSNSPIGLRDTIIGVGGYGATDDPEKGALLALLSKAARSKGNSIAGKSLWSLGKYLETNPAAASKYAPAIQAAMRRGIGNVLLTSQLIAKKDPEYASFLQQLLQGVEE